MSSLKKGLDKQKMHRSGDVIVYKKDTTFGQTKEFDAQIQIIGIPNEIKIGHSITTGRLIVELGSIPEREPEKLKAEDDRLGKSSFAFAFCMDRQKEERERGVIIACTTEEFSTEKLHFTNIDAPGHCDFIKNMITGTSQALIMVPCDENFTIAIAKRNHKVGEIQGQTHQHSRLINLLGVKQIAIGCNKMDCDTTGYKITSYEEVSHEMKSMLVKVGWEKEVVESPVPFLLISGSMGDNLYKIQDCKGVEGIGMASMLMSMAQR